jgi:hypothetical protein
VLKAVAEPLVFIPPTKPLSFIKATKVELPVPAT